MRATVIDSEATILNRLLEANETPLTPAAARYFLGLTFSPSDRQIMQELAAKARAGELSPAERIELHNFELVGHFLSIMKSKARRVLKKDRAGRQPHES